MELCFYSSKISLQAFASSWWCKMMDDFWTFSDSQDKFPVCDMLCSPTTWVGGERACVSSPHYICYTTTCAYVCCTTSYHASVLYLLLVVVSVCVCHRCHLFWNQQLDPMFPVGLVSTTDTHIHTVSAASHTCGHTHTHMHGQMSCGTACLYLCASWWIWRWSSGVYVYVSVDISRAELLTINIWSRLSAYSVHR